MPKAIKVYVRYVDGFNRVVGRMAMYMIFVMIGVLLLSSVSRTIFDTYFIWIIETAQFLMAAYYLLGGGYTMQLNSHVRMDLLYGRWSPRGKAIGDVLTSFFLIFYLVLLLYGGISSTEYALQYGQKNYSAWAPPLAPIKIIMVIGITMMLLQVISIFFKDVAKIRGVDLSVETSS